MKVQPISVSCARCHARPGQYCSDPAGKTVGMHLPRLDRAHALTKKAEAALPITVRALGAEADDLVLCDNCFASITAPASSMIDFRERGHALCEDCLKALKKAIDARLEELAPPCEVPGCTVKHAAGTPHARVETLRLAKPAEVAS